MGEFEYFFFFSPCSFLVAIKFHLYVVIVLKHISGYTIKKVYCIGEKVILMKRLKRQFDFFCSSLNVLLALLYASLQSLTLILFSLMWQSDWTLPISKRLSFILSLKILLCCAVTFVTYCVFISVTTCFTSLLKADCDTMEQLHMYLM